MHDCKLVCLNPGEGLENGSAEPLHYGIVTPHGCYVVTRDQARPTHIVAAEWPNGFIALADARRVVEPDHEARWLQIFYGPATADELLQVEAEEREQLATEGRP
jgi:hypothetical protein